MIISTCFKKQKKLTGKKLLNSFIVLGVLVSISTISILFVYREVDNSYQLVGIAYAEGIQGENVQEAGFFISIWNYINSLFGDSDSLKGSIYDSAGTDITDMVDDEKFKEIVGVVEAREFFQGSGPEINISWKMVQTTDELVLVRERFYDLAYDNELPDGCTQFCWAKDKEVDVSGMSSYVDVYDEKWIPRKLRYKVILLESMTKAKLGLESKYSNEVLGGAYPVQNFSVDNNSDGKLLLSWDKPAYSFEALMALDLYIEGELVKNIDKVDVFFSKHELDLATYIGEMLEVRARTGSILGSEMLYTSSYSKVEAQIVGSGAKLGEVPMVELYMSGDDGILKWDYEGSGDDVISYEIYISTDGSEYILYSNFENTDYATNPSYEFTFSLEYGSNYNFAVRPIGVDSIGTLSEPSNEVEPIQEIENFETETYLEDGFYVSDLSWSLPDGGSSIDSFYIVRNSAIIASVQYPETDYADISHTLYRNVDYKYDIYAVGQEEYAYSDVESTPYLKLLEDPEVVDAYVQGETLMMLEFEDQQNGTDATSYQIYIREGANQYTLVEVINQEDLINGKYIYPVDGELGETYKFKVRAINEYVQSGFSNESDQITVEPFVNNLQVYALGDTAQLTWDIGQNGVSVDSYIILQNGVDIGGLDAIETSFVVSDLAIGEWYSFELVSVIDGIWISYSDVVNVVIPDVPEIRSVEGIGSDIFLTIDGHAPVFNQTEHYDLYRSNDGINYSIIATVDSNGYGWDEYIDNTVALDSLFYYKVKFYYDNYTTYGESLFSEPIDGVALLENPSIDSIESYGPEVSVNISYIGNEEYIDTFSIWRSDTGSGAESNFVEYDQIGEALDEELQVYIDYGVEYGKTYSYKLFAVNEHSISNESNISDEIILLDIPVLSITPDFEESILSWDAVNNAEEYYLEYSSDEGATYQLLYSGPDSSFTHNVTVSEEYRYRVKAVNSKSESLFSNVVSGIIQPFRGIKGQVYYPSEDESDISDYSLWVGTDLGLNRYNGIWRSYTEEDGLGSNNINTIYKDREDNMWFGTSGGVTKYDGITWRLFTTTDGLASNDVLSVYQDSEGSMWFGTDGSGLSKYDGSTWETFTENDGLGSSIISCILEDSQGVLWFCSKDYGMTRLLDDEWFGYDWNDTPLSSYINSIVENSDGHIWVSSVDRGIIEYDGESWSSRPLVIDGINISSVDAMTIDQAGNIWFSMLWFGVGKYDGLEYTRFMDANNLSGGHVVAITQDINGDMYFGTNNDPLNGTINGLVKYDGINWTLITTDDGLVSNYITSVGYSSKVIITDELINDAKVSLYSEGSDGQLIAETVTDGNGYYEFDGLSNDTYFIKVDSKKLTPEGLPVKTEKNNLFTVKQKETNEVEFLGGQVFVNINLYSLNIDKKGSWGEDIRVDLSDLSKLEEGKWETESVGTDYAYMDLNYDGKVDLHDLGRLVDRDYWEFPF